MKVIDSFFSPSFIQRLNPMLSTSSIDNIESELIELVIAGFYYNNTGHVIWIVGENENLDEKKEKLELWLDVIREPSLEISIVFYTIPFEDPYINNEIDARSIGNKAGLIRSLQSKKRSIILTTLSALSLKVEPPNRFSEFFLEISKNRIISRQLLITQLNNMGYQSRNIVEEKGDISWRGSIVDVFPIDSEYPVRIEIEGDTIISLRLFDPDSQKSLKQIENIVFPVCHFYLDYESLSGYFNATGENMCYLTDIIGEHNIVVSDKKKVEDEFQKLLDNYEAIFHIGLEKEPNLQPPSKLFLFNLRNKTIFSIDETWNTIDEEPEWVRFPKTFPELNLQDIGLINEKLEKGNYNLFIFAPGQKENFRLLFESFKSFIYVDARIPCSLENRKTRSIFLSDKVFHYFEKINQTPRLKSENFVKEIHIGDIVVHQKHGIGKFVGFKRLNIEGSHTEFLKIEYLNNEFLYVPVYELDVLDKYIAFEGQSAKMDKLGGTTWAVKKRNAQKSIITFARELLELYAMRKAIKGNSYPRDYEMEERLESGFRFVETEDQKKAIKEVMLDLEKEYPMDRLLCGDVSFGKTEVALRAALRVVASGKQVALLCPTTILAYQHYTTFKNRFALFPINIAMLSRMVSPKKRKETVSLLKDGKVDILIGTHSLISRDIQFKRLGLYIIDEEQRFGVFQKEKIKHGREDVDVLSMSATPIPRTLSFSLAGLHDISIIQTPPIGRIAIKNYVGYFSKEIVMSAVLSELERDGSVFIVYNDIDRIYSFREEFRQWLPYIPAQIIHAKMKTEEIETNLIAFIDKKVRVLISTTIIENGIDIPGVNTLIVLDADRFGLTQLYQLRGRIGRGNRQAYAYFLVKSMDISEKAKARLDAIRDFADLGVGYKLAEFDLKLRGAGSMLGNRQHGHIEALGFDYYHRLLVKTVKELKGELESGKEAKISIHFPYSIDPDYIKNSTERISLYRRILEARELKTLTELRIELEDRYGKLPNSIDKIFYAGVIRVLVNTWRLDEVDVYIDRVILKFQEESIAESVFAFSVKEKVIFDQVRVQCIDKRTREFLFPEYKAFTRFIYSQNAWVS